MFRTMVVVKDETWFLSKRNHGRCRRQTMVVVDGEPCSLSMTNHGRCRRRTMVVVEDEPWSLSKMNHGRCRRRTMVVVEGEPWSLSKTNPSPVVLRPQEAEPCAVATTRSRVLCCCNYRKPSPLPLQLQKREFKRLKNPKATFRRILVNVPGFT